MAAAERRAVEAGEGTSTLPVRTAALSSMGVTRKERDCLRGRDGVGGKDVWEKANTDTPWTTDAIQRAKLLLHSTENNLRLLGGACLEA